MALTLDIEFTAETIDGDIFQGTLTDSTTYGGANPARSAGALYVTGEKMKADNTADYDITIDAYDAETWTTVTFDIEEDGYNKFGIVFIRDYDNGYAYARYEAAYNDSDNLVYRALQATTGNAPPNTTYWEVISEPTSLIDNEGTASESPNLEYQVYERIIYPFSKQGFGTLCAQAALDCCSDCERPDDVLSYEQLGVYVDGMNVADQRGLYLTGEKIARDAQTALSRCLS